MVSTSPVDVMLYQVLQIHCQNLFAMETGDHHRLINYSLIYDYLQIIGLNKDVNTLRIGGALNIWFTMVIMQLMMMFWFFFA